MSEIELRECPFCGSDVAQIVCDVADWPSVVCSVHEGGCGASSGHCSSGSRDEAVAAWNRRADDVTSFDDCAPYFEVTEAGLAMLKDGE